MFRIDKLNEDYAVIDLDTGTVLGTNLVLVRMPTHQEDAVEDILSNDSIAFDYGQHNGLPLYSSVAKGD